MNDNQAHRGALLARKRRGITRNGQGVWGVEPDSLPGAGLSAQEIMDAIHRGEIKALFSMCFNPLVSLPDANFTREALSKLEAGERYDAIVSDLMMPGMSGMDLHAAILALAPDQVRRMVFMTGGAFTPQARRFFDEVRCPTLEKPFDRANLLAAIDCVMAAT